MTRVVFSRVLVHVVDINLLAARGTAVRLLTAFFPRFEEKLTIVVGAAILPSRGNIVIVRASLWIFNGRVPRMTPGIGAILL